MGHNTLTILDAAPIWTPATSPTTREKLVAAGKIPDVPYAEWCAELDLLGLPHAQYWRRYYDDGHSPSGAYQCSAALLAAAAESSSGRTKEDNDPIDSADAQSAE